MELKFKGKICTYDEFNDIYFIKKRITCIKSLIYHGLIKNENNVHKLLFIELFKRLLRENFSDIRTCWEVYIKDLNIVGISLDDITIVQLAPFMIKTHSIEGGNFYC